MSEINKSVIKSEINCVVSTVIELKLNRLGVKLLLVIIPL